MMMINDDSGGGGAVVVPVQGMGRVRDGKWLDAVSPTAAATKRMPTSQHSGTPMPSQLIVFHCGASIVFC